jgi:hypothetical protein
MAPRVLADRSGRSLPLCPSPKERKASFRSLDRDELQSLKDRSFQEAK